MTGVRLEKECCLEAQTSAAAKLLLSYLYYLKFYFCLAENKLGLYYKDQSFNHIEVNIMSVLIRNTFCEKKKT